LQPDTAHFLEDAFDAFAEFLADAQVCADACDARVACEAADFEWAAQVPQAREPARAPDFDAVGEDFDADVVAGDAVGAVDDGVDETFESIPRRAPLLESLHETSRSSL
jgi:hypothetical protein